MRAVLDDSLRACADAIVRHSSPVLRTLLLFGSRAHVEHPAVSDIDLLAVIEPHSVAWGPAENIAERKRLHRLTQPQCPVPIDLWVRTIDQFEEAREVIGGVEYLAATRGVGVYSRPSTRAALVRRSRDEVRRQNVCDLLEDARRLVGRAVQAEMARLPDGVYRSKPAAHYAWRAIQHGVRSVFAWRQVETPEKHDDLDTVINKLRDADSRAATRLVALHQAISPTASIARATLREIASYLATDPALSPTTGHLQRWLAQPLYRLADVPALKP